MQTPVCSFNHDQLRELYAFFTRDSNCPRNEEVKCDAMYNKNDSCAEACALVRQFGQGFSFHKLMEIVNNKFTKQYTSCFPSRILGKGNFGLVLGIVLSDGENYIEYALKLNKLMVRDDNAKLLFQNETRVHKKFHEIGATVEMIHSEIFSREDCSYEVGIILMEKVLMTYHEFIHHNQNNYMKATTTHEKNKLIADRQGFCQQVADLIELCKINKLTHGDLHTQNVVLVVTPQSVGMKFVDFGRSTHFYANTILDYSAFAHSEPFMIPIMYENSKDEQLSAFEGLYDGNVQGMFSIHEPELKGVKGLGENEVSLLPNPSSVINGKALAYKLFMLTLRPHTDILNIMIRHCEPLP